MKQSAEFIQCCPVCRSEDFVFFKKVDDYFLSREIFTIYRCKGCGLLVTGDAPKEEDSGRYYISENYISHSDQHESSLLGMGYKTVRNIMFGQKYRWIRKLKPLSGKVLDLGCGTGHFLQYMKDKGWEVKGVEPSEAAAVYAQKKLGIPVIHPRDFFAGEHSEQFDLITLWHVLEHIYDPESYLKMVRSVLKPEGVVCVAVPNPCSWDARYFREFWAAWDVPRHIWHFPQDCLVRLFSHAGFELLAVRRMPFDVFYISILSARYKRKWFWFNMLFAGLSGFILSCFHKKNTSSLAYFFRKIS